MKFIFPSLFIGHFLLGCAGDYSKVHNIKSVSLNTISPPTIIGHVDKSSKNVLAISSNFSRGGEVNTKAKDYETFPKNGEIEKYIAAPGDYSIRYGNNKLELDYTAIFNESASLFASIGTNLIRNQLYQSLLIGLGHQFKIGHISLLASSAVSGYTSDIYIVDSIAEYYPDTTYIKLNNNYGIGLALCFGLGVSYLFERHSIRPFIGYQYNLLSDFATEYPLSVLKIGISRYILGIRKSLYGKNAISLGYSLDYLHDQIGGRSLWNIEISIERTIK